MTSRELRKRALEWKRRAAESERQIIEPVLFDIYTKLFESLMKIGVPAQTISQWKQTGDGAAE